MRLGALTEARQAEEDPPPSVVGARGLLGRRQRAASLADVDRLLDAVADRLHDQSHHGLDRSPPLRRPDAQQVFVHGAGASSSTSMNSELVVELRDGAGGGCAARHRDVDVDVRLAMGTGAGGGRVPGRRPDGRAQLRVDDRRRGEAVPAGRRRRRGGSELNRRRLASSQHSAEHLVAKKTQDNDRVNDERQGVEEAVGEWPTTGDGVQLLAVGLARRRLAAVDLSHLEVTGARKIVDIRRRRQLVLASNFLLHVLRRRATISK